MHARLGACIIKSLPMDTEIEVGATMREANAGNKYCNYINKAAGGSQGDMWALELEIPDGLSPKKGFLVSR